MAMFFSPSLTALIGPRAWWPGIKKSQFRPPVSEAVQPAGAQR
jgi:hypothetical protein